MLLKITERCTMGCSHCLEDAKCTGNDMDFKTFKRAIEWIKEHNARVVSFTGGEPTEHSMVVEFIKFAQRKNPYAIYTLISNGLFLDNAVLRDRIFGLNIGVQVTNDTRYYPKRINETFTHPLLARETHIRSLYPQGRASNDEPIACTAPKCFNIRSIAKQTDSLAAIINIMESKFKFCTPSIDSYGNIIIGESKLCYKVGTIWDDDAVIIENIRKMKCNLCGMEDRLSPMHKAYLHLEV